MEASDYHTTPPFTTHESMRAFFTWEKEMYKKGVDNISKGKK